MGSLALLEPKNLAVFEWPIKGSLSSLKGFKLEIFTSFFSSDFESVFA